MNKGSTFFLRAVIYLIGLAVLGVSIISLFVIAKSGILIPIMALFYVTTIPFFFALYQGLLLLRYIDKNTAFSEQSVHAIKMIKRSALAISALYALGMPYIIYVAEIDDAPGAAVIGLVFIFVPLVVSVFAAVLQRLLENAIAIKSENDLTV